MLSAVLVGMGGFIGSLLRYLLAEMIYKYAAFADFPYGTLVINVSGCFLFGALNGFFEARQFFIPELRLFLFVGVLGGFTTFSTFGFETFALARDSEALKAAGNVLLHVVFGFGALWAGNNLVTGVLR